MCGIVGYIGTEDVKGNFIKGLRKTRIPWL